MKLEKYNCKLHWLFVSETCENWSQNYSVSVTRVAPSCCCSLIFTWPLYICLCLHQSISESTYLSIPIYLSISLYILRRPVSRSCCYSCTRTHFALSGVVGTYLVKLVSVWPDQMITFFIFAHLEHWKFAFSDNNLPNSKRLLQHLIFWQSGDNSPKSGQTETSLTRYVPTTPDSAKWVLVQE